MLENKLAAAQVSEEQQKNLMNDLEKKTYSITLYCKPFICKHIRNIVFFSLDGHVYAMKKLKKSEMLRRGQVEHVTIDLLAEVDRNCMVTCLGGELEVQFRFVAGRLRLGRWMV
ncbi:hypothetical protein Rs2_26934 [Raphanus sativus]|nr:hypothetical protein Rs2_26934 [Raphanus sativus]